ncbi:MAG: electron transfer flavoprotein subunit beta/FixA family protein [Candidatus Kariarchaeaceae archaeon]|jgi:electron transfer flavoprotein beta subunit
MKIAVLLKIVPDTETRFQLNPEETDVITDRTTEWILGPYDEYAVEEAIRIKEKVGGQVITVTIGSGNEEKSIRKAMAMGVDEAILVESEGLAGSDPLTIAKVLAEQVKTLDADIILAGKMATDTSDSFVGPAVAQLLGIPVITEISSLEVREDGVTATRTASGRSEKFESKLPVVLTADKSLNDPRYPKLPDIMKAKKKPLHKKESAISPRGAITQIKAAFPPQKAGGTKIEGTTEEVVSVLMDGLTTKEKIF